MELHLSDVFPRSGRRDPPPPPHRFPCRCRNRVRRGGTDGTQYLRLPRPTRRPARHHGVGGYGVILTDHGKGRGIVYRIPIVPGVGQRRCSPCGSAHPPAESLRGGNRHRQSPRPEKSGQKGAPGLPLKKNRPVCSRFPGSA